MSFDFSRRSLQGGLGSANQASASTQMQSTHQMALIKQSQALNMPKEFICAHLDFSTPVTVNPRHLDITEYPWWLAHHQGVPPGPNMIVYNHEGSTIHGRGCYERFAEGDSALPAIFQGRAPMSGPQEHLPFQSHPAPHVASPAQQLIMHHAHPAPAPAGVPRSVDASGPAEIPGIAATHGDVFPSQPDSSDDLLFSSFIVQIEAYGAVDVADSGMDMGFEPPTAVLPTGITTDFAHASITADSHGQASFSQSQTASTMCTTDFGQGWSETGPPATVLSGDDTSGQFPYSATAQTSGGASTTQPSTNDISGPSTARPHAGTTRTGKKTFGGSMAATDSSFVMHQSQNSSQHMVSSFNQRTSVINAHTRPAVLSRKEIEDRDRQLLYLRSMGHSIPVVRQMISFDNSVAYLRRRYRQLLKRMPDDERSEHEKKRNMLAYRMDLLARATRSLQSP